MIIFEKLKRLKKLTESEKEIVAYILNQPEEFISLSAKQIARNCYVSVPTIYRLCEKAGVSGLAEMKVQLSRNLSDYLAQNTAFDFDYPIKAKEAHDSIARNITEDYKETVKQTQALLDMSEMHKAVMALANARHISIYTSAGNVYMADNFRFQMQEIGIDVNVPTDEYELRLAACNAKENDLGIIISFGGRGTLVHVAAEILKANQARILLITSPEENSLYPFADIKLFMCSQEDHAKKVSSFSTRLSILYILDNLYAGLFSLNYEENIRRKNDNYAKLTKGTQAGYQHIIEKK